MSSRRHHLWLSAAGLLSLLVTVQNFRDPDVWWHLALGRLITAHGIPGHEPFSFLATTRTWIGQQWLYEVTLARLVDIGGPGLASLALGLVASAALVLAALATPARARISSPWRAGCLLASALVAGQILGVRGQVVTVLGVAVVLLILSHWRDGGTRAVWALPPVLLLWSNLHAGFIAGLAIPLVVLATHRPGAGSPAVRRRPLLLAIAVAGLATLVNPAGAGIYPYVADTFTNPTLTQSIVEWMSPNFHDFFPRLFEVEAAALVAVWLAAKGPDRADGVLAGGAFIATLQAQRNVALFAIIALPQLIRYGSEGWRLRRPALEWRRAPGALLVANAAILIGVVISIFPGLSRSAAASYETRTYPSAAVDHVQRRLPGERIYTTYDLGGYLAYRIPTGRIVFIYGESAIFGDAGLQRYLNIHLLRPGWPAAIAREGIRHAILPTDNQEVSALHELGWTVDCRDRRSHSLVMSAPGAAAPDADSRC